MQYSSGNMRYDEFIYMGTQTYINRTRYDIAKHHYFFKMTYVLTKQRDGAGFQTVVISLHLFQSWI